MKYIRTFEKFKTKIKIKDGQALLDVHPEEETDKGKTQSVGVDPEQLIPGQANNVVDDLPEKKIKNFAGISSEPSLTTSANKKNK